VVDSYRYLAWHAWACPGHWLEIVGHKSSAIPRGWDEAMEPQVHESRHVYMHLEKLQP
jgi:hypothetical protein